MSRAAICPPLSAHPLCCRSTPRCPSARCRATAPGWSTSDGHEWLDAYGGHAVASTGHSHPASCGPSPTRRPRFSSTPPRCRTRFASGWPSGWPRCCPDPLGRVFFCNSGAEANENALRLARRHTGRQTIVSVRGGWHGRTVAHARRDRRRQVRGRRAPRRACRSHARCRSTTWTRSMRRWTTPSRR